MSGVIDSLQPIAVHYFTYPFEFTPPTAISALRLLLLVLDQSLLSCQRCHGSLAAVKQRVSSAEVMPIPIEEGRG